jgi:hypothetical protein
MTLRTFTTVAAIGFLAFGVSQGAPLIAEYREAEQRAQELQAEAAASRAQIAATDALCTRLLEGKVTLADAVADLTKSEVPTNVKNLHYFHAQASDGELAARYLVNKSRAMEDVGQYASAMPRIDAEFRAMFPEAK